MAVSGTVPAKSERFQPQRLAVRLRRATFVLAAVLFTWFFVRFGARWVPAGMNTIATIPPGSFCIVDRWSNGLRVGSDVFVATPVGELLSRVTELTEHTVRIEHPNPHARYVDSRSFGALPRDDVLATVMVVFASGQQERRGR